jgi:hypothetical protein
VDKEQKTEQNVLLRHLLLGQIGTKRLGAQHAPVLHASLNCKKKSVAIPNFKNFPTLIKI